MRVAGVSFLLGSLLVAVQGAGCGGGSTALGDGGAECGNGRLEPGEACDSAIGAGEPGACPTTCPMDTDACTSDVPVGSAETCSAQCAITTCEPGDGCCAGGCNANDDTDCAPICGNDIVEPGEFCDGSCPTSCDDGDECTADSLSGTECTRVCQHEGIAMCGPRALDDVLRINHIQMKGTHNSFHLRPAFVHPDWDYEHAPLDVQFESQGVRAIELDVFWNWVAGRFDAYHVYLVDDRSTCRVFQDCLRTIRAWSDAHPYHHPILVQIEPKGDAGTDVTHMAALEEEILAILPRHQVITPDDVRGAAATLRDAVTMTGWPTLRQSRGKVLFFLDCGRDLCVAYANEGASLDGRVIFAASQASDTWAGVMVINNPGTAVTTAAQAGYIVRTRAFDVGDAQDNDYSSVAPALASGGHIISTDIPAPVPEYEQHLTIPGGTPSRCNPVTAPIECTSLAIEDPAELAP